MDETLDKKLDNQTQMIVAGKEQTLIMVNEAHEDLLDKKLKVMRSKQFFDLSKQLTALQGKLAMEHMIRKREIDMKFEQDKEGIIQEGLTGSQLDDAIERLGAEKEFDIAESQRKLTTEQKEAELELRQQ